MTEIKTTDGRVLFFFDESKTTLAKEIGGYRNLMHADLRGANLMGANLRYSNLSDADLMGADLENANLWGADLENANLISAKLNFANLCRANLKGANLMGADIREADLENANLWGANLISAKLISAKLNFANLEGANLEGADFSDADISDANIRGAKNVPDLPLACPSEGSFIAWKKVKGQYLIKLEIPEDAKRSSATTKKCRCDKALVLNIEYMWNGEHPNKVVNYNYCECVYEIGKMVYPDWFDENRWDECSHGIHFFINKQDAIMY